MNIYIAFLVFISITKFVHGILPIEEEQKEEGVKKAGDECKPVNIMLNRRETYNCCLDEGVTCKNGHIIKMYVIIYRYYLIILLLKICFTISKKYEKLILNNNNISLLYKKIIYISFKKIHIILKFILHFILEILIVED